MTSTDLVVFENITSTYVRECFFEAYQEFYGLHENQIIIRQKASSKYTMRAQPVLNRHFFNKGKRAYRIDISNRAKLLEFIRIEELPPKVLIGWFAHELGHIIDYFNRSWWEFIVFGLGYLYFPSYRLMAERKADLFALEYGFADHVIATKRYILEHSHLPDNYKDRISKYYMSPEEIALIIEKVPD